jgi:class 3 adenylate cyclase
VVVGDLIGDGSGREFELIGKAPNLAARLLELAEPNQILVAPSTRKLLGDLLEFEVSVTNASKGSTSRSTFGGQFDRARFQVGSKPATLRT